MTAAFAVLALCALLAPVRAVEGDGVDLVQTQLVSNDESVPKGGGLLKKSHDHSEADTEVHTGVHRKSHDHHKERHLNRVYDEETAEEEVKAQLEEEMEEMEEEEEKDEIKALNKEEEQKPVKGHHGDNKKHTKASPSHLHTKGKDAHKKVKSHQTTTHKKKSSSSHVKAVSNKVIAEDNKLAGKAFRTVDIDEDEEKSHHHSGRKPSGHYKKHGHGHSKKSKLHRENPVNDDDLPESDDRVYSCCDTTDNVNGGHASFWQDWVTHSPDAKPYCTEEWYNAECDCSLQGYPVGSTACVSTNRTALCEVCTECFDGGCSKLADRRRRTTPHKYWRIGNSVSGSTQTGGDLRTLSCCDRGDLSAGSDKLWREWLTRADPSDGSARAMYCTGTWYATNCQGVSASAQATAGVDNLCTVCSTCYSEGCDRWEDDQGKIVDVRGR